MIRKVKQEDAAAIAAIYNDHVKHTCVTFEDEEVSVAEMQKRISEISSHYLYLVYEAENGEIAGYCYAHGWKEKQAYRLTAETTIYIAPAFQRQGIGKALMNELIVKCREAGLHVLIACITYPNPGSEKLHVGLGFQQVSRFHEVGYKFGQWLDIYDFELRL